jgi:hypothetical protein
LHHKGLCLLGLSWHSGGQRLPECGGRPAMGGRDAALAAFPGAPSSLTAPAFWNAAAGPPWAGATPLWLRAERFRGTSPDDMSRHRTGNGFAGSQSGVMATALQIA